MTSSSDPSNALSLRGEYWQVSYGGRTALIEDCRGLRYLAILIRDAPAGAGPIQARELVALATGQAPGPVELERDDYVREAQRRVILELQGRTNITRQELARLLGVDAKTLRSRLKGGADAAVAPDAVPSKRDRLLPS